MQSGPIIRSLWQQLAGLTKGVFRKQKDNVGSYLPNVTNDGINQDLQNNAGQDAMPQIDEQDNDLAAGNNDSDHEGSLSPNE
jgi:hypothetical protein